MQSDFVFFQANSNDNDENVMISKEHSGWHPAVSIPRMVNRVVSSHTRHAFGGRQFLEGFVVGGQSPSANHK
jgi:hypothetical protein